ncbi:Hypothetical predicted protein [Paramuricea clavata]|uniref:Deoxyribonuclease NucA/NucB domain-containing protein n=1 Tax=Paramuricea clavata TaxID=317549 RepID=A0A6S7IZJ8_PARCT|nr:Hypothetical predicted protein [Paramuricea clavata]
MKVLLHLVCIVLFVAFTTASILEDFIADEIENDELFLEKRAPCPTITFPCGRGTVMPNVCQNMRTAIAKGHPTRLHRITDSKAIAKNRRDSGCTRMRKTPGNNCDEYPFASSREGGAGAEIKLVPSRENSKQGGLLGAFYRKHKIGNGGCYNVRV